MTSKKQPVAGWRSHLKENLQYPGFSIFTLDNIRIEDCYSPLDTSGKVWTWLPASGMGEFADTWQFHFGATKWEDPWWGEVKAPSSWEGRLVEDTLVITPQTGCVVGEFVVEGRWNYWIGQVVKTQSPELPQLGAGKNIANVDMEDLVLLGVLRPETEFADNINRLMHVAWGDKEGKFLGWTECSGMDEVRQQLKFEDLSVTWWGEWEFFERRIRHDLWGREI